MMLCLNKFPSHLPTQSDNMVALPYTQLWAQYPTLYLSSNGE